MDYERLAENAQHTDEALRFSSAVKTLLFEDSISTSDLEDLQQFKCIKEYFESPVGAPEEEDIKKILNAAITAANDSNVLPFKIPDDPKLLSSFVDDGLTRAKVAYKVATGEMDIEDAEDIIIDHYASRAIAMVEYAFDSGIANKMITEGIIKAGYLVPFVGETVGPFLETKRAIISSVVKRAEPSIKNGVIKGINLSAKYAKTCAHKATGYIKEKSRKVYNKIFG